MVDMGAMVEWEEWDDMSILLARWIEPNLGIYMMLQ